MNVFQQATVHECLSQLPLAVRCEIIMFAGNFSRVRARPVRRPRIEPPTVPGTFRSDLVTLPGLTPSSPLW